MLSHSKEGKLCLEDEDGAVELDFSHLASATLNAHIPTDICAQDQPSEGLFTEGCLALVEGDYTDNATLTVIAIGHPPCENREAARSIYGHIDFLGKGATTLAEDVRTYDCHHWNPLNYVRNRINWRTGCAWIGQT